MKLMIVDDSSIIRRKIERAMGAGLFEVVAHAADGEQAVKKFEETRPDLVTMDLTMPNMDGIECVEKLVNLDPSVRILVVSALSDKATAIEALKMGANGFLCKPFTDEQLVSALRELCEDCANA